MTQPSISRAEWDAYIRRFHTERPGITDEVLRRCTHDTQTPYEWVAEGLSPLPRVLDLACGNGPLQSLVGTGWIGIDAARGEVDAIASAGAVALGDARQLPVRAATCDAVVCSMALMLISPLDDVLAEMARILRPGGTVRLLLPARRGSRLRDQARYLRLAAALRTTALFPPSPLYRHAHEALARAGLTITDDSTRRFAYPIRNRADAQLVVESLYLPGVEAARVAAGICAAAAWAGSELGIPLRRITAKFHTASET